MGSPDTPRREIEVSLAEAGLHRDPLATLRAPARQHRGSALGLHARSESVLLRALTPVRLESALGHEKWLLLIRSMASRQTMSINDPPRTRQTEASPRSEYSTQNFALSHAQNLLAHLANSCLIFFSQHVERTLLSACRVPAGTKFFVLQTFRRHLPLPSPHSAELRAKCAFPATRSRAIILCTTHVAVIHSLLDNAKSSRSNPVCAKKFLREVFHAAKYFVLVCRLFYLLKFLRPGTRSQQTGGALH